MEISKTIGEKMASARELENAGQLSEAAVIYQKLFTSDPTGEQTMGRLLVIYRKLKEYRKELAVLDDAITAYRLSQKLAREKWIDEHPKAASTGRSMLRQLEKAGNPLTGFGDNSLIGRLLKRKELVTRRITGKKAKVTANPGKDKKGHTPQKKEPRLPATQKKTGKKQQQQKDAAAARKKAAQDRKDAAVRKKREEQERKAALRRKESLRRKKEQEEKKAEAKAHPSLFVVILRYLVPIGEIDAAMKQHMAYLDKHYDNGNFLVSGRQVPRTGGVILAQATNRNAIEKVIKQDPFVKRKLASADIIEFAVSQVGKGLEEWLKPA